MNLTALRIANACLAAASWLLLLGFLLFVLTLPCPARAETWVDVSLASHHFGPRVTDDGGTGPWQEKNPGLGIEHALTDRIGLVGGVFHNSINHTSTYAGLSLHAVDIGPVRLGAQVMAATGYTTRDWGALLTASVGGGNTRVQILFAPRIQGTTSGLLALRVGIRFD